MPPFVRKSQDQTRLFVGRETAVEAFRASVRYQRKLAQPPTTAYYPHVFVAHGEGGMGKTTLLNRWLDVATEEGWPSNQMLVLHLDSTRTYPEIHDFAEALRAVAIQCHPGFGSQYQATRARYQQHLPRFNELERHWVEIQALRNSGKLDHLVATHQAHLAHDTLKAARLDASQTTYSLTSQINDSRASLLALSRFTKERGQIPATFAEFVRFEMGADASLFLETTDSVTAFAADLEAIAQEGQLLLAIDTYELADQHDDWLREVFLAVGEQLLLVLAGRNAIHTREAHQRAFSDDWKPLVWHVDLGRELFTQLDVETYLQRFLARSIPDALVNEVVNISRGIPLAVNALADEIKHSGNVALYQGMEFERLDRRTVVQTVTKRFLRYANDQHNDDPATVERKRHDRFRIRTLCMLLRLDPDVLPLVWGLDQAATRTALRELSERYSFIFAGISQDTYELHDLVREFVRLDVKETSGQSLDWPLAREALARALPLLRERVARTTQATPEDCYAYPRWHAAILDLLNTLIWLEHEQEAQTLLLNHWVAAQHYTIAWAKALRKLVATCPTPTPTWKRLIDALTPRKKVYGYGWDYTLLAPYEARMEPHTRTIWYYLHAQNHTIAWVDTEAAESTNNHYIHLLERAYAHEATWAPIQNALATALFNRGWYAIEQQKYQRALESHQRSLELRPNDADTLMGRGLAKHNLGDYAGGLADFDRSLEVRPDDAITLNNRGNAKYAIGDHAGALADFDHSLEVRPDHADTLNNRGNTKGNLDDHTGALADYDRALEVRPDDSATLNNRGNAKGNLGDYAGALADYDRALEVRPDDATTLNNRGNAKGNLGDYAGALADYDRALEVRPDDSATLNNRGYLNIQLRNFAGALVDIQRALELAPHNFAPLTSMAELLIAQDLFDQAFEWIEQAIAADPARAYVVMHTSADYDPLRDDPRFGALLGGV